MLLNLTRLINRYLHPHGEKQESHDETDGQTGAHCGTHGVRGNWGDKHGRTENNCNILLA